MPESDYPNNLSKEDQAALAEFEAEGGKAEPEAGSRALPAKSRARWPVALAVALAFVSWIAWRATRPPKPTLQP
jgi:hypothetical protein